MWFILSHLPPTPNIVFTNHQLQSGKRESLNTVFAKETASQEFWGTRKVTIHFWGTGDILR